MANDDIVIRFFNDDKSEVMLDPNSFGYIAGSIVECLQEASKYAALSDKLREFLNEPIVIKVVAVDRGSIKVAFRAIFNFPNKYKEEINNYKNLAELMTIICSAVGAVALHYGFFKVDLDISENIKSQIVQIANNPDFNKDKRLPIALENFSSAVLDAGAQRAVIMLPDQPDYEFSREAVHPQFLGISGSSIDPRYLHSALNAEVKIGEEAGEFEVSGKKVKLYFAQLKMNDYLNSPSREMNFSVLVKWESKFEVPKEKDGFVTISGYMNEIRPPDNIHFSGKITRELRNVSALLTVTSRRMDG